MPQNSSGQSLDRQRQASSCFARFRRRHPLLVVLLLANLVYCCTYLCIRINYSGCQLHIARQNPASSVGIAYAKGGATVLPAGRFGYTIKQMFLPAFMLDRLILDRDFGIEEDDADVIRV